AMRAIMARAESLTDEGLWPSAQLMDESALAFEAAVRLQRCSPVGTAQSFPGRSPNWARCIHGYSAQFARPFEATPLSVNAATRCQRLRLPKRARRVAPGVAGARHPWVL